MDDAARRWLELQRDLGGDELWFDTPVKLKPHASPKAPAQVVAETPARRARTVAEPAPPPVREYPPIRLREYPADQLPAWLAGAPDIPSAGLDVTAAVTDQQRAAWPDLGAIAAEASTCIRCPLAAGRTNAVPGEGNPDAGLMLVGEGPGEQEDLSGRPFVGRAGDLLDKILLSIDAPRPAVYIANVVKCRPPKNRAPLPDERAACMPYLHRQIELVKPRVLLALGATAAEALLGIRKPLGELRMKVHRYNGIPLIVTYHPAALLRNPNWKRPAWDDVRIARRLLDSVD